MLILQMLIPDVYSKGQDERQMSSHPTPTPTLIVGQAGKLAYSFAYNSRNFNILMSPFESS
jgi:hypothetical protein